MRTPCQSFDLTHSGVQIILQLLELLSGMLLGNIEGRFNCLVQPCSANRRHIQMPVFPRRPSMRPVASSEMIERSFDSDRIMPTSYSKLCVLDRLHSFYYSSSLPAQLHQLQILRSFLREQITPILGSGDIL